MVLLDGNSLTLELLLDIADARADVSLTDDARHNVERARDVVDRMSAGDAPVYGLNTGFGALAETSIPRESLDALQCNLLRSHAAGVGQPLSDRAVRASMALR